MGKVDELRECGNKRRDVCRRMEQRWILFYKKILHFPATVFRRLVFCWAILRVLDLGLIFEVQLGSILWVDDWRQEGFGSVRHVEGKGLDVASYPGERLDAGGFGEG